MTWLWLGLGISASLVVLIVVFGFVLYWVLRIKFLHFVVRIFQEKPLFIIPKGQPLADAEDVELITSDGLKLAGCYWKAAEPRKGVILFGVEFGSNRWSCVPYCEHLHANGFDIFSFELRSQGESEHLAGYEPLQWVTHYEVFDMRAAIDYLKNRADADPRGAGFFGISKGGSAGLMASAPDPFIRCFVTDGIFATYSTMLPYMRKWITIYSPHRILQAIIPLWFYGIIGTAALNRIRKASGCRFPHLEQALPRLAPRPLLMIHGGGDTYIKPEMAQALFARARSPKQLWIVEGAKHNQALNVAGTEYRERILDFFLTHLASGAGPERGKDKGKPVDNNVPIRSGVGAHSAPALPQTSLLDAR